MKNSIIVRNLCGNWQVTLENGRIYPVHIPGTLDESQIGEKDKSKAACHPAEGLGEVTNSEADEVITTRLTRRFTYEGKAAYRTSFVLDTAMAGKRVFLEVERSRKLSLRLNGKEIPCYTEGTVSTPYVFEITESLRPQNQVELICDNSYEDWPREDIIYSSAATDETQTNWNGLLGYVQLRIEEAAFVSDLRVYTQGNELTVILELDSLKAYTGKLCVKSEALNTSYEKEISEEAGRFTLVFDKLTLKDDVKRWDEEEGNLYDLTVSGDMLSEKTVTFGIRDFCWDEEGRFTLNNRRFFLRGEANCCVFPETGHMPMTEQEWEHVIRTYQSYGVNCLRFHSHCPVEAAFQTADRLGMMIQPELSHWNPRNAFSTAESIAYYRLELQQILKAYANHPSFVMLTFGNELQADEAGHAQMHELLRMAKKIDPTRLYANASNAHYGALGADSESDFYTASDYYKDQIRAISSGPIGYINDKYPDTKKNFDDIMAKIRKDYRKPVFGFEVGQYEVLPDFKELDQYRGVTIPDNIAIIQKQVQEAGMLEYWEEMVSATGELSRISYREEVEVILRTKGMSGLSLLGLQDFTGQGTALVGMLNPHLEPKPYPFAKPEAFKAFFTEVLPLVYLDKYTYSNRETLSAEVRIANYGREDINGAVRYELSDEDGIRVMAGFIDDKYSAQPILFSKGTVESAGSLTISLTDFHNAVRLNLKILVTGKNGRSYSNTYPIWVYPKEEYNCPDGIVIVRTREEAEAALSIGMKVFYSPEATKENFPASIRATFTPDFWSVGTFPVQEGFMGTLIEKEHPVFESFPTEKYTNWQWWIMMKGRSVMIPKDLKPIVRGIDSYAYLRTMGLLFEGNYLGGKIVVSSMGLLEQQKYPEAKALLNSILRYMASDAFKPDYEFHEWML